MGQVALDVFAASKGRKAIFRICESVNCGKIIGVFHSEDNAATVQYFFAKQRKNTTRGALYPNRGISIPGGQALDWDTFPVDRIQNWADFLA